MRVRGKKIKIVGQLNRIGTELSSFVNFYVGSVFCSMESVAFSEDLRQFSEILCEADIFYS